MRISLYYFKCSLCYKYLYLELSEIKNYDYTFTCTEYYLSVLYIAMQISYEMSWYQNNT
jgi:hypothetical protein